MTQRRITDDLHILMGVLPPEIADAVSKANNSDNLIEIIMDLGRRLLPGSLLERLNCWTAK